MKDRKTHFAIMNFLNNMTHNSYSRGQCLRFCSPHILNIFQEKGNMLVRFVDFWYCQYLWPGTESVEHIEEHKTGKRHGGVPWSDLIVPQLKKEKNVLD